MQYVSEFRVYRHLRLVLLLVLINSFGGISLASGQEGNIQLSHVEKHVLSPWLDSLSKMWVIQNSLKSVPLKHAGIISSGQSSHTTPGRQAIADSLDALVGDVLPEFSEATFQYIELLTGEKRTETEILLGYCRPYIRYTDSLLKDAGLPAILRFLPLAHSAMYYKAVSDKGASGPWQLMYIPARRYGLQVDSYVDQRREFHASARAAMRMLTDLYEVYNEWPLAIAAYSCGPANVNKAIRRSGGKKSLEEIWQFLPSPERALIPALPAFAYIFTWQEELGLQARSIGANGRFETVMIDHQLHLGQVAAVMNMPIAYLRELNPQYRYDVIPGEVREMPLLLPAGQINSYLALADSIAAYNDSVFFKPAVIRPKSSAGSSSSPASYAGKTAITYTVRSGDNLGFIADRFNVSISQLKYWNGIRGTLIRAGQRLTIYVPDSKVTYYKNLVKSGSSKPSATTRPSPPTRGSSTTYTVRPGDNPTTIAAKFPGVSADEIMKANNISNPRKLYVGQKLRIPK